MALIVQNDTGMVPDANGYIDVSFFRDYHTSRDTNVSELTADQISRCIVVATDYVDSRFKFVGRKLNGRDQSTEWPRIDAEDRDGFPVDGIPQEVKEAAAEYALRATKSDLNPDPERDNTGAIVQSKSVRVGPISRQFSYFNGAGMPLPRYPAADQKMTKSGLILSGTRIKIYG